MSKLNIHLKSVAVSLSLVMAVSSAFAAEKASCCQKAEAKDCCEKMKCCEKAAAQGDKVAPAVDSHAKGYPAGDTHAGHSHAEHAGH